MKVNKNIIAAVVMIIGFSNLVNAKQRFNKIASAEPQWASHSQPPCPFRDKNSLLSHGITNTTNGVVGQSPDAIR